MNHVKSIPYSMLQFLDVTDCCSLKSRFQISPDIKNQRELVHVNEQATLLIHLVLSTETLCSRILQLLEENVVYRYHV
jgi:hypothetical protein